MNTYLAIAIVTLAGWAVPFTMAVVLSLTLFRSTDYYGRPYGWRADVQDAFRTFTFRRPVDRPPFANHK